jgi:hypothetical protein
MILIFFERVKNPDPLIDEKLNSKTRLQMPFFGFFEHLREILASNFANGANRTLIKLSHKNSIWVSKTPI